MKHMKTVSRKPACAQDIPTSEKLLFIVDVLDAFSPLLVAKNGN